MSKQIPEIIESSKFNLITSIWIVPFIALIIAGWLAYQHFAKRGPEIRIVFPQNEGLIAGQSVVKFRNIPVGKVTKIYAEAETEGVIVVVRMNTRESKSYMTEHAKFWIVKPEVGLSGISGLDTLLSGTYINVHAKPGGKQFRKKFIGLTQPYRDSKGGDYFRLSSINGDDVVIGTPIYYKNIEVGQVEYMYLSLDNKKIEVVVFIDKEYVPFIHHDSKFWIKNIVNIDLSRGNLDLNIAPIKHLLEGGITFSSYGKNKADPIPPQHIFPLYKNKTQAKGKMVGSFVPTNQTFKLRTEESIANLKLGSLVRFDGFDIGKVSDIQLSYDKQKHKMLGEVLLDIDTSVFEDKNERDSSGVANLYQAVEEGLRAKVSALDPITGMLFIDLTFAHHDGNGTVIQDGKYARLPMASQSSNGIMTSIAQILDKLNNLPLEKLLKNVNKIVEESAKPIDNANVLLLDLQTTVKNINKLTSKKSFEVLPDELSLALKEMTRTLKSTEKVVKGYDSDSLVKQQLTQTLQILTKTSQEMQVFLRMLNRKPNSLIFGDN